MKILNFSTELVQSFAQKFVNRNKKVTRKYILKALLSPFTFHHASKLQKLQKLHNWTSSLKSSRGPKTNANVQ